MFEFGCQQLTATSFHPTHQWKTTIPTSKQSTNGAFSTAILNYQRDPMVYEPHITGLYTNFIDQ